MSICNCALSGKNIDAIQSLKQCSKCIQFKDFSEFNKNKNSKDGFSVHCKSCRKVASKKYYKKNKECISRRKKLWVENNQDHVKEKRKKYYLDNREKLLNKQNQYYEENKEIILSKIANYIRKKRKKDITTRIKDNARTRLYNAIKGKHKRGSAVEDLGCSIEFFIKYIESQFYVHPETGEKMAWDNWGRTGWNLDHKQALVSFNLEDREDFLKAVNYINYQPLWIEDHKKKTKEDLKKEKM